MAEKTKKSNREKIREGQEAVKKVLESTNLRKEIQKKKKTSKKKKTRLQRIMDILRGAKRTPPKNRTDATIKAAKEMSGVDVSHMATKKKPKKK